LTGQFYTGEFTDGARQFSVWRSASGIYWWAEEWKDGCRDTKHELTDELWAAFSEVIPEVCDAKA
jgi:hypothetical protein